MDINVRGVTSLLERYLMVGDRGYGDGEGEVGHRNSHWCILSPVVAAHFCTTAKLPTVWLYHAISSKATTFQPKENGRSPLNHRTEHSVLNFNLRSAERAGNCRCKLKQSF
ncbi:hypothetical protein EVAR_98843_1 [Eumeta japonica]|uniref:Uncharacterized protein n=1 Tax=Eumeta variegata TaxID=151549 RepID=A0A4C1YLI1_EUMVA|nr:hypothetical protein EVAR_98843_1 [Eumeta japonica]